MGALASPASRKLAVLTRDAQIPAHSALTIQLLGPDDMTLDDAFDGADSWEYYRASYVLTNPTEGIGAGVVAPLLRRCAQTSIFAVDVGLSNAQESRTCCWAAGRRRLRDL